MQSVPIFSEFKSFSSSTAYAFILLPFSCAARVCVCLSVGVCLSVSRWSDQVYAAGTNPKPPHLFIHPYFQVGQPRAPYYAYCSIFLPFTQKFDISSSPCLYLPHLHSLSFAASEGLLFSHFPILFSANSFFSPLLSLNHSFPLSLLPSLASPSLTPSLSHPLPLSLLPSLVLSLSHSFPLSLLPSLTPSLSLSLTPSLPHPFPLSLLPSLTPSLSHPLPLSLLPSLTLSLSHSFPLSSSPSRTPSLSHSFPLSHSPSLTPSVPHSLSLLPSLTLSLSHSFPPSPSPSLTPSLSYFFPPSPSPSLTPFLLHPLLPSLTSFLPHPLPLSLLSSSTLSLPPSLPPSLHPFLLPLLQAVLMFLGEMSCFLVFKIWYYYHVVAKKDLEKFGPQKFNPLIWSIPAMCDLCATSTMYLGLTWTYAASFQMLRGSVIIFTGLLSVAFLNTKLKLYQWIGMFTVIIGLALVGIGDVVFFKGGQHMEKNTVLAGDLLIILAQGIVAVQMTVEEKIIKKYQVPALQGVGWEGIFGFSVLTILLFPMYFTPWHLPASSDFWQDTVRFEDAIDGIYQIGNSWQLLVSTLGLVFSIAFFNFSGLTVTKTMSATTRMVLDSVRTIFIWVFSLSIMWQSFEALQPVGYFMLFVGTCIYYDLIIMPSVRWILRKTVRRNQGDIGRYYEQEKQPFLPHVPINEPLPDRPPYGLDEDSS